MLFTLPVPVTDEELPPAKGSLAMRLQPPPLTSFLCLLQRSLAEIGHCCFTEIVCADSAGRLLFNAKPRQAPAASATTSAPLPRQTLVICDVNTLQVKHLPLPGAVTPNEIKCDFLLFDPLDGGGDAYIVVALQVDSSGCFQNILAAADLASTKGPYPGSRSVLHPLRSSHRAIPLDGEVWWIDTTHGLVACDVSRGLHQ